LMTPHELKRTMNKPGNKASGSDIIPSTPTVESPINSAASTKRSMEGDDDHPRPPPALRIGPSAHTATNEPGGSTPSLLERMSGSLPAKPPPQRKADPAASMFIARKKDLKRAPQGDSGPSNAKKRITEEMQRSRGP